MLIDAEESWIQSEINSITKSLLLRFNKTAPIIYLTIQLYLKESAEQLKTLHNFSVVNDCFLGIKLVRGAYLEKEINHATLYDVPSPIFDSKSETDTNYNTAITYCVSHIDKISICVATHNEESVMHLVKCMANNNIKVNDPRIYSAQLYGMGNHISFNLIKSRYNVVKYLPYGPVKEVIPYLIRRADENKGIKDQNSRELLLIQQELTRRKNCI